MEKILQEQEPAPTSGSHDGERQADIKLVTQLVRDMEFMGLITLGESSNPPDEKKAA